MDTVIIWHICDILWKFQPSSSIFRLWHLEAKILKWPENGQNPKGGPLDEKNIFSTMFLDLVENRLKWLDILCWFQKYVYQYCFWHLMSSIDIVCHMMSCDDISWRLMSKSTLIYMFLESALSFWSFKPILNQIWECGLTNIFFHPRVSPLDFDHFSVICPKGFWAKVGVLLKAIETSSFHQSSSFCYNLIPLDGI